MSVIKEQNSEKSDFFEDMESKDNSKNKVLEESDNLNNSENLDVSNMPLDSKEYIPDHVVKNNGNKEIDTTIKPKLKLLEI